MTYSCVGCSTQWEVWSSKCGQCGRQNALVPLGADPNQRMMVGAAMSSPMMQGSQQIYGYHQPSPVIPSLNTLTSPAPPEIPRKKTGVDVLDRALSGGMVIGSSMLLCGEAGVGKCLGEDTPILLHDGSIVPVQDVRRGDFLMGPDSRPREVLSTSRGRGPLYRITPIKGDPWVCNDAHILTLSGSNRNRGRIRDVALSTLLAERKGKRKDGRIDTHWKLFRVQVRFKPSPVPVDPYLVGLWLGDGSRSAGAQLTNSEPEIISYCEAIAKRYDCETVLRRDERCHTYNIRFRLIEKDRKKIWRKHRLAQFFDNECVDGPHKKIPRLYLHNSGRVRRKLLAGLLDTDGSLMHGCYDWATVSPLLRDDMLYLCRSLGFATNWHTIKVKGKKYYRLTISGETSRIPCKVKRKIAPKRKQIKRTNVTGFSAKSIGVGDYYGFTLDGDGRFLLGDFTVTHNTTVVMKACAKMAAPDFRVGYVTSEQQDSLLLHRAREIGAVNEHFEICRTQDVAQAMMKARTSGWALCVFDSLQEFVGARLRDFQFPPTRIFISRMNKEGGIWGSTDNEHDPDVLLMCEYAAFGDDLRLIKANKNRYGATGSLATSYYTISAAGVEEWVDPDAKEKKSRTRKSKKDEEIVNEG